MWKWSWKPEQMPRLLVMICIMRWVSSPGQLQDPTRRQDWLPQRQQFRAYVPVCVALVKITLRRYAQKELLSFEEKWKSALQTLSGGAPCAHSARHQTTAKIIIALQPWTMQDSRASQWASRSRAICRAWAISRRLRSLTLP